VLDDGDGGSGGGLVSEEHISLRGPWPGAFLFLTAFDQRSKNHDKKSESDGLGDSVYSFPPPTVLRDAADARSFAPSFDPVFQQRKLCDAGRGS